jgi:2-hydroxy-3-oxopropionate reductase
MKKIGFIGLGIMGKPMAKNLLKAGYPVVCYDIVKANVDEVCAAGAKCGESNKDVAARSEIIITMLPNSPHVKEAVFGQNGIIEGASKGSILVDMSSIDPMVSKEVYAGLQEKGIEMLDAPVSGGEPKAIDGMLSIMAGGKEDVFNEVKDILLKMGASAVLVGDIGSGNVTKLANQIIVALNIAAVSEAMTLAVKTGVDPEKVYQAIRGGLAGSTVLDAKAPMMISRNFKPGFRINLHIKDLQNALNAGHNVNAYLPLTSHVMETMQALRADGKGDLDHSAIANYYEKLCGAEIKKA